MHDIQYKHNCNYVCRPTSTLFTFSPYHRVVTVNHRYLPYLGCQWLTENSIVCAGHDCYPVLWSHDDGGALTYVNKLDQKEKKEAGRIR